MTYNKNQPEDLPPPNIGVQSVRENFLQYANVFDNNHVALNSSSQGKHNNVFLQQQGSNPVVQGSFDSLFIKPIISNLIPSEELFVTIPQFLTRDKPNIPMQLTFNFVNIAGPQYQSFLAGGYIIYFGSVAGATTVSSQVTLVPTPSKILCVIPNPTKLSPLANSGPLAPQRVSVTIDNSSQFTIKATQPIIPTGTGTIRWLAIAKQ